MQRTEEAKLQRDAAVHAIQANAKKVREERAAKYKDPEDGHRQLGCIWAAMLSAEFQIEIPPLPPRLVMHMFCAQKMHRACMDGHIDHFVDLQVYNELAMEQAVLDAIRKGEEEYAKFMNKEKN